MIEMKWVMSENRLTASYRSYRITIDRIQAVEQNAYRSAGWVIIHTIGGNDFTIASGVAVDVYCAQNITAAIIGLKA